jgi:hypothetical protein
VLLAVVCSLAPALAQTTGGVGQRHRRDRRGAAGRDRHRRERRAQGTRVAVGDGRGSTGWCCCRRALLDPLRARPVPRGQVAATVALGRDATLDQSSIRRPPARSTSSPTCRPSTPLGRARHQPLDARSSAALGTQLRHLRQIAPGTSSDANPENTGQGTITVYGSTGNENSFFIDGVNTTGVEYGFQGKELNFEFIQAIEVKAGGYEAEYGRATGGIVSVITKSGGNEPAATFGYFDDDSLQSSADPTISTGASRRLHRQTTASTSATSSRTSSGSSPPTTGRNSTDSICPAVRSPARSSSRPASATSVRPS